jgi:hypothetical protein
MDALATLPPPMREALTPHLSMLLGVRLSLISTE